MLFRSSPIFDSIKDCPDCLMNGLGIKDFGCIVKKHNVYSFIGGQLGFLESVTFAESSFEKIALYGSFEKLLWHANQYPSLSQPVSGKKTIFHSGDASESSF